MCILFIQVGGRRMSDDVNDAVDTEFYDTDVWTTKLKYKHPFIKKDKNRVLKHINPGNCFILLFAIGIIYLIYLGYIISHS